MILYHATTQKQAKKYRENGVIIKPVRGFDTLKAAMFWAMKTGRKVIYEIETNTTYKLPDHHNQFGKAYWSDENVPVSKIKCVVSAT